MYSFGFFELVHYPYYFHNSYLYPYHAYHQSLNEVLNGLSLSSYFKLGLHYNASITLKPLENDTFVSAYTLDGVIKSGQEIVDKCMGVWQEGDMVMVDDLLDVRDASALRYLKKVREGVCVCMYVYMYVCMYVSVVCAWICMQVLV
ncbi:hypothetical protein EON63_08860 [archaeon]|nr:MAG: hypothetical protein EON63_08860 [archaeon]